MSEQAIISDVMDEEWVTLIIEAKNMGINIEEVKQFLKSNNNNKIDI